MESVENSWEMFGMAENGTPYHFFDKAIKIIGLEKAAKDAKNRFFAHFSVKMLITRDSIEKTQKFLWIMAIQHLYNLC